MNVQLKPTGLLCWMTMGDTRGKETQVGLGKEEEGEEGKLHTAQEESQSCVTEENDDTDKSNDTNTSCLATYKDNNTKKDDLTGVTGRSEEHNINEDIAVSNTLICGTDISTIGS